MKVRVITAIIGIIAVLGLVYLGGWFLTGAIFLVSLLAILEYDKMLKHFGVHIYLKATAIATAVMVLASGFYSLKAFLAAIFLAFVLLLYLILGIKKENMTGLIYSAFGAVYFGVGFGSLALLRGSHELLSPVAVSMEPGIFLILLALICTWASDSFAYLTGKACGRHKMAPHISPNKTVEGLVGGVILGVLVSFCAGFDLLEGCILSVMAAIMAPMGDLFESYVKRACDIKDSGNILPGHGGMMDRFDSLLFVAPSLVAVLALLR